MTAREGTAPGQAAYEPDPWRDDLKAEQVAQAAYEASLTVIAADLDGEPWAWESLPFKVKTSWHAASHAAIDEWQRQNAETVLATLEDIAAREAAIAAAAAAQPARRPITDQELAADPAYRAYEAYAMAAPDDLNFPEWEDLPEWQRQAIRAAAQEAHETRAQQEAAAQPAPGPHYSTPDVECADCRAETELAEAIADRDDYAARLRDTDASWARVAAERDLLRELVDEVGVMAANAPEDDGFAVCEQIAMRIAAADIPDATPTSEQPAPAAADGGPCPGCESLRRQHAETCGEVGFLAGALSEIARRTAGSGQGLAIAAHGIARDALERLHAGGAAPADGLAALVRDMLQAFPDTADEQEWRDRAGALGICGPDGKPYRAYTEEGL